MRIAVASIISAVVLFFLGFLWWGMLMPIAKPASVISDTTLVDKMGSTLAETGIYFHPSYAEQPQENTGPMVILFYNSTAPSMPVMMGSGLVHMLVSAFLVSLFVAWLARPTFMQRFAVVFFLGLFVAVWADAGNMIWWTHPPKWAAFHFGYDVVSWLVAGLIIAAIVKPKPLDL